MSVATLGAIPESFIAGDTVIFSVGAVAAYPVADWEATIVFNHDGIPDLAKTATVSGGNYLFTLGKEDTRSLPSRMYDVAIYCTDGVERVTIASSISSGYDYADCCCQWPYASAPWRVRVLPNLQDERPATIWEKALADCQAQFAAVMVSKYSSTSFSGQSQTEKTLTELQRSLAFFEFKVREERAALCNGRDINIHPRLA